MALFDELKVIRPKPNGDASVTGEEQNIATYFPIISVAYWKFKGTVADLSTQGDIEKIYWVDSGTKDTDGDELGYLYKWNGYNYNAQKKKYIHEWVKYREGSVKISVTVTPEDCYKSGGYLYNLRNIAVFLYGINGYSSTSTTESGTSTTTSTSINPQFGVPKVSENFWQIVDITKSVTLDDEYFNFDRLSIRSPLTDSEYKSNTLYNPKEDSTVLKCYAALKKAVAMAGFYCTALPLSPYQQNMSTPFIQFYERAISSDGDGNFDPTLPESWSENQLDTTIYEKDEKEFKYFEKYTINPITHIVELGKKSYLVRDKIRDLYNRAERITIQRPVINFGQEETTNSEFEETDSNRFTQCLAKINAAYDFNIPVIELESGEKKDYIFNKFTLEWEEIEMNQYPCVSFNSDGGTVVSSIYKKEGSIIKISDIDAPTKTGYTFSYWKTEDEKYKIGPGGGDTYTVGTEDIIFNAVWEKNQYTISFNLDGATIIEGQWTNIGPKEYGSDIKSDWKNWTNPTKNGAIFSGWFPSLPDTMPAENQTYEAIWEQRTFRIIYDTDGGTAIPTKSYLPGAEIEAVNDPARVGYTFGGWDWGTTDIPKVMPAYDVVVRAKWNPSFYKITMRYPEGSKISDVVEDGLIYNQDISEKITNKDWSYHTFKGWYKNPDYTIPFSDTKMPNQDLELYAKFEIRSYTMSFVNPALDSITKNYNEEIPNDELNNPSIRGYAFLGWNRLMKDGSLIKYEIPKTMPGENLVLIGTSTPYIGCFCFKSENELKNTVIRTQNQQIKEEDITLPSKSGYDFVEWKYTPVGATEKTKFPVPCTLGDDIPSLVEDTIFEIDAEFTKQKYKLTFDKETCGLEADLIKDNVEFGSIIELPAVSIEGYDFKGWYYLDGEEQQTKTSIEFPKTNEGKYTVPAFSIKEIKIYAKLEKKSITLTFNTNWDAFERESVTLQYATEYKLSPITKTRDGYTFGGWYYDEKLTNKCKDTITIPANNLTIYAKWTPIDAAEGKEFPLET